MKAHIYPIPYPLFPNQHICSPEVRVKQTWTTDGVHSSSSGNSRWRFHRSSASHPILPASPSIFTAPRPILSAFAVPAGYIICTVSSHNSPTHPDTSPTAIPGFSPIPATASESFFSSTTLSFSAKCRIFISYCSPICCTAAANRFPNASNHQRTFCNFDSVHQTSLTRYVKGKTCSTRYV